MSKRRQPKPTERVPCLPELGEQNLCLLQILGVEALGEPVVDRGEQVTRFCAPALVAPEPRQTHSGTQLERFGFLGASGFDGSAETVFCTALVSGIEAQQQFAPDAMQF